ncbi:hypothetical protein L9F63_024164, partial [Diploptera punctata]
ELRSMRRKNYEALFVATRDIAVSRVLFLHKHDCSALCQQLQLLPKGFWQLFIFWITYIHTYMV